MGPRGRRRRGQKESWGEQISYWTAGAARKEEECGKWLFVRPTDRRVEMDDRRFGSGAISQREEGGAWGETRTVGYEVTRRPVRQEGKRNVRPRPTKKVRRVVCSREKKLVFFS